MRSLHLGTVGATPALCPCLPTLGRAEKLLPRPFRFGFWEVAAHITKDLSPLTPRLKFGALPSPPHPTPPQIRDRPSHLLTCFPAPPVHFRRRTWLGRCLLRGICFAPTRTCLYQLRFSTLRFIYFYHEHDKTL